MSTRRFAASSAIVYTIFALGIFGLGWFVAGLKTGWSVSQEEDLLLDRPEPEAVGAAAE